MGKIDLGLTCPKCNGSMQYDTDTEVFTCDDCKTEFTKKDLVEKWKKRK